LDVGRPDFGYVPANLWIRSGQLSVAVRPTLGRGCPYCAIINSMKETVRICPTNESFPVTEDILDASPAVLHIETTGRYWRNSRIQNFYLIRKEDGVFRERIFGLEKEPEEYELLERLPELLGERKGQDSDAAQQHVLPQILLTYNGTSFDLPYLRNKLKAYGLADPIAAVRHLDLMREMKNLPLLLQLPSYRLDDFRTFFGSPQTDDACTILNLISLESYLDFFRGKYEYVRAFCDEGHLFYELRLLNAVPAKASMNDGPFHLLLDRERAVLSSKRTDGRLRVYFPDTENYDYLPGEGCAVHKSMSAFIGKARKEKAVRENCFTLVKFDDAFMQNEKRLKDYLSAAVTYLETPILN